MKVHKIICIDYVLAQRLGQEENASALINSWLMAHYQGLKSEGEIIAGVKDKMKQKEQDSGREARIVAGVKKRTTEMRKIKK